jgi:hypothetical protein
MPKRKLLNPITPDERSLSIWAREAKLSLPRMCSTCASTVRLERTSRPAICRLDSPSATSEIPAPQKRAAPSATVPSTRRQLVDDLLPCSPHHQPADEQQIRVQPAADYRWPPGNRAVNASREEVENR